MGGRMMDALKELRKIAEKIYDDLANARVPAIQLPSRTKSNIKFDDRYRVWKYGSQKITRAANTLAGAYMLLRTVYTLDFIRQMIEQRKTSTLRELYYISEGWGDAKFHSQDESDKLAEDLEILTNRLREDLKLRPEEDGARVIGDIVIEEVTRKGEKRRIHCQDDVGDSGYSIPYNVEKEKIKFIKTNADKVIAIEKGGLFTRFIEERVHKRFNAILIHTAGQAPRATRRFIRRLNEELGLPVYILTDGDPWGMHIAMVIISGSAEAAHIRGLTTPDAKWIGVWATDIVDYKLPSDPLTEIDIKRLHELERDPRYKDVLWQREIKTFLKIKKKSELEAFSRYGLTYIVDEYLPTKLKEVD